MIRLKIGETNYISTTVLEKVWVFGIGSTATASNPSNIQGPLMLKTEDYYYLFQISNDMNESEILFQPYWNTGATFSSGDLNENTRMAIRQNEFRVIVNQSYESSDKEYRGFINLAGGNIDDDAQWTYKIWAISQYAVPRPFYNDGNPTGTMSVPNGSLLLETGRLLVEL